MGLFSFAGKKVDTNSYSLPLIMGAAPYRAGCFVALDVLIEECQITLQLVGAAL